MTNNTAQTATNENGSYDWEQRPTVNPYRHGMKLISRRLAWDLSWKSWLSRRRLRLWKDQYPGQKAIIACNGPSLKKVDFDDLKNSGVFTFGLNKINLLFSDTSFRPDCIAAVNGYVIEQNRDFYNETRIPLFIDYSYARMIDFRKNVIFLHSTAAPRRFARDCSISLTLGHTVTYVALQLAFHMGFTRIGLIGCDHQFSKQGSPNLTVSAGDRDADHFHPSYFAGGAKWQLPDFTGMETHYELARETYQQFGRQIFNCTEGGKLEIFERMSLPDFLEL